MDHIVPSLLRLIDREPRNCLSYEEHVGALEEVRRRGRQSHLNAHIMPQHLACRVPLSTPTLVFDVNVASEFLLRLHGYHLTRVECMHLHATNSPSSYDTSRLTALARPEYDFVDRLGLSSAGNSRSGTHRPRS